MESDREILDLLQKIVSGEDRSRKIARNLGGTIIACYPEADTDERFEKLMYVLDSYEPRGGDYLYNSEQLADECRRVLERLS